jgi:predicted nuclease of predicted toxin-antitoxin system
MRLVVDVNLSPDWASVLISAGHDVVHWRDIGALDAPDSEIADWAQRNARVVLTHDLDYGTLLAVTGATGPSVIQMRAEDVRPAAMAPILVATIQQLDEECSSAFLATIDPRRHRISLLPLRT